MKVYCVCLFVVMNDSFGLFLVSTLLVIYIYISVVTFSSASLFFRDCRTNTFGIFLSQRLSSFFVVFNDYFFFYHLVDHHHHHRRRYSSQTFHIFARVCWFCFCVQKKRNFDRVVFVFLRLWLLSLSLFGTILREEKDKQTKNKRLLSVLFVSYCIIFFYLFIENNKKKPNTHTNHVDYSISI